MLKIDTILVVTNSTVHLKSVVVYSKCNIDKSQPSVFYYNCVYSINFKCFKPILTEPFTSR